MYLDFQTLTRYLQNQLLKLNLYSASAQPLIDVKIHYLRKIVVVLFSNLGYEVVARLIFLVDEFGRVVLNDHPAQGGHRAGDIVQVVDKLRLALI